MDILMNVSNLSNLCVVWWLHACVPGRHRVPAMLHENACSRGMFSGTNVTAADAGQEQAETPQLLLQHSRYGALFCTYLVYYACPAPYPEGTRNTRIKKDF